jgi:hypothetical protein
MASAAPAESPLPWTAWRRAALLLLALKIGGLLLDPQLRLFLLDSAIYFQSALDGRPPLDRSFVYPWLVRTVALGSGSGLALVLLQTLCGWLAALLLLGLLVRRFGVREPLALALAALFALEPAQLFYERMLMAEATGGVLLVAAFTSHAAYLQRGRPGWLLAAAVFGLGAATLRLNLLPVVLTWTVLVPALLVGATRAWGRGALHLALALAAAATLHLGYRQAYAHLSHEPPGYHGASGRFQLALVAPLVEPEHLVQAGLPATLLQQVTIGLRDPRLREAQLWRQGGLVEVVSRHASEPDETAGRIARAALREHPLGLLRMAAGLWRDHFDDTLMRDRLADDLGRRAVNERIRGELQRRLGVDASEAQRQRGAVRAWFAVGAPWLVLTLVLLPLLALLVPWLARDLPGRPLRLLLALTSLGLVASHVLFSPIVSYRYLHPLPWFLLANLGLLAEAMLRRRRAAAQPASGARSRR